MFRSRPDIYTSRRSDTATVASTASPRAPPPPVTKFHSAVSATAACASSAAPVSQGMRDCPLSQSMGDCALRRSVGDGDLHLERSPQPWYGRGARASSAALPRHAPRSTRTAAPARRSFQQGCPLSPPSGHVVAVSSRCGKADTRNPEISVRARLSAFPRNGGVAALPFFLSSRSPQD